jgi:Protein tyrosine and serine/threonine kinase
LQSFIFSHLIFAETPNNSHPFCDTGISSSAFHDQADIIELNFDKKQFSFEELRIITNDFRDHLGTGGFGKVFKGQLQTGMEVAVKVRTETSSQGIREFLNEVRIVFQFPNCKYYI